MKITMKIATYEINIRLWKNGLILIRLVWIFCRQTHSEKSNILLLLSELHSNGLIKTVGETESYTRVVQNENEVKVVKQMPKMVQAKQPTIAIITAQYCEKLAVDSMMDNQETFVRYTTVGNVYLSPLVLNHVMSVFEFGRWIKCLHTGKYWLPSCCLH